MNLDGILGTVTDALKGLVGLGVAAVRHLEHSLRRRLFHGDMCFEKPRFDHVGRPEEVKRGVEGDCRGRLGPVLAAFDEQGGHRGSGIVERRVFDHSPALDVAGAADDDLGIIDLAG